METVAVTTNRASEIHLELSKQGREIGRDPASMTASELKALGHTPKPLLQIIKERCLDCCAQQKSEVRMCTAADCVNWVYRLGNNPMKPKKRISKRQTDALHQGREKRLENIQQK